jgi:hypothetical protein
MRGYVESLPALERASVLILNWVLTGSGSLHESLQYDDAENELFELLEADSSLADGQHMIHSLTLRPEPASAITERSESDWDDDLPEGEDSNPLLTSFLGRIDREHSISGSVVRGLKSNDEESTGPWLSRLEALAGRVSQTAVAVRSRGLGTEWFDSANDDAADFDEQ